VGNECQSLAWAATTLKQLELRAPPLSCKVYYVAVAQIIPTVMHRATKAPWTLAQYRSLDRIISSFYRRIFKVKRTFPEAHCGLGMKRFSDDAQRLKWWSTLTSLPHSEDSGFRSPLMLLLGTNHTSYTSQVSPTFVSRFFIILKS
jgi:hypothetical protein